MDERLAKLLEIWYRLSRVGYVEVELLPTSAGDTVIVKAGVSLDDEDIKKLLDTANSIIPVESWSVMAVEDDGEPSIWLYINLKEEDAGDSEEQA